MHARGAVDLALGRRSATLTYQYLERTLYVLEGIAAEGKERITYENCRERAGLRRLVAAMES